MSDNLWLLHPRFTFPHTQGPEVAGEAKPVDGEQRVRGGQNQKASEGQQDYRDRNQRPRNKSRTDEASSSRAGAAGDSGSSPGLPSAP